jgi:RHS repeat-associated protein
MALEQKYQYNGIELTNDFGLMINEARYRTLDPQLGRWWQIDPKVEQFEAWSAYNSNLDNPIRYEDKDGDTPLIPAMAIGFAIGFTVDIGFQVGAQVYQGGWKSVKFENISFSNAVISGTGGALTVLGGAGIGTLGLSKGSQLGLQALNNGSVGTLESVVKQIVTTGDVDPSKTVSDAIISTAAGSYGDVASHNAGEFIGEVGAKAQATMDATIGTVSEIMENTGQGISDIQRTKPATPTSQTTTSTTTAPKKPYVPSKLSRTAPQPVPPSQSPQ